jgi:hypothetical protein
MHNKFKKLGAKKMGSIITKKKDVKGKSLV